MIKKLTILCIEKFNIEKPLIEIEKFTVWFRNPDNYEPLIKYNQKSGKIEIFE